MIERLLAKGIKKNTVDILADNDTSYNDFEINIDDVVDIIDYLRSIGIKNIDSLLLCTPDLFIGTKRDVENMFKNKNMIELVDLINDDIDNVELLYE